MYSLKTPCYVIDEKELKYNISSIIDAFYKYWGPNLCIGYSVKTNHLKWLLEYIKALGIYAEVVSKDEYLYSMKIGYSPGNIIFNGPYKDQDILTFAILNNSIVNIDSFSELEILTKLKDTKSIEVGLRVNFDLEKACPNETLMGTEPSRFGFCIENDEFSRAMKFCENNNIKVVGIHMHQSSTSRSERVFKELSKKAAECIELHGLENQLKYIDIGGGLFGGRGVTSMPSFEDYAKTIYGELKGVVSTEKIKLIIEPGASIIATPISYLTKVVDIKNIRGKRIITVDGTTLHINPFLKKRYPGYDLLSLGKTYEKEQIICGSTCMEDDRLLYLRNSKKLEIGDMIEIKKCGSYTMCYNSCFINLPPPVYVKLDNYYSLIREAWSIDMLL